MQFRENRRSAETGNRGLITGIGFFSFFLVLILQGCGKPLIDSNPTGYYQLSGGYRNGPFALDRVELVFGSGRMDRTLRRGEKIQVLARIRFAGQGNLRARWLLDGQVLELVNLNLDRGSLLTLSLRHPPASRSLEPGYHSLRLEIEQPPVDFTMPSLKFFVTE